LEKDKLEQAKENQNILKTFYSILKDAEEHLQMLFITGVSKFSKVSIFSDLNHISDLTLNQDYATIVGYTQDELEFSFADFIEVTQHDLGLSHEDFLSSIKKKYGGFSWDGNIQLYNPSSLLNLFYNRAFRNYWYASGTPSFFVNLMKENIRYKFEKQYMSKSFLEKCNLDDLGMIPIMFQSGYLTIKETNTEGNMLLDFPNQEVRDAYSCFSD
jgi:Predicted AAA-ATPase